MIDCFDLASICYRRNHDLEHSVMQLVVWCDFYRRPSRNSNISLILFHYNDYSQYGSLCRSVFQDIRRCLSSSVLVILEVRLELDVVETVVQGRCTGKNCFFGFVTMCSY